MTEQLDRIEKKLDAVHAMVHEHNGFMSAAKWLMSGLGAGFMALLGYVSLKGHS